MPRVPKMKYPGRDRIPLGIATEPPPTGVLGLESVSIGRSRAAGWAHKAAEGADYLYSLANQVL